ncbi:PKD domain-containing protein [Halomicroarcula sp. F28]|uniref:PKD domain-containing protein n=1 Tax=Haloarcula salinisoli TaxID=2487746 RepID=UPI001C7381FA|nr:PKD domain-containing protein [Halomicroarcula salinisoli]MBX0287613.1 PKD domain-containing protein [Halomicroarcula salinisoli]
MTEQTPDERGVDSTEDTESGSLRQSRRSLLASMGVGVAGLALGGVTGSAEATEEPAAEYADSSSPATTATSDGSWSDGATWDNGVPTAGQAVRIDPDVTITVDSVTEKIKTLDVAGTLEFATDTDSNLRVETIVTRPDSTMHIGTESDPISPDSEARITIVHHEDISEKDNDPERISKGLITMGELEIHGAEKTSWTELASAPKSGDTKLELPEAPTNWNEGDEIVVPGLDPKENEDEERTIASVSGAAVELDEPLEHDHVPPENKLDVELTAYALNLTRNVVMESEVQERDPDKEARINRQGHMMVMQPAQSLHNFRTIHLGRTNKDFKFDKQPIDEESLHGDEPNPKSRYSVHFHRTGLGAEPHEVSGVVAQNSPGWGIVNHHSHANVRDSITYQVYGSGFVTESGPERGSFKRCFALRSRGSDFKGYLQTRLGHEDFGHEGHGFWFQGPGVAMEDCVAAGHDKYAYAMYGEMLDPGHSSGGGNYPNELAIEDGLLPEDADPDGTSKSKYLPFKSFTRNTAFASGGGLDYVEFDGKSEVKKSVVDTFTVYNIYAYGKYGRYGGNRMGEGGKCAITQRYADYLHVKNPQLCNNDVGGGHGFRPNFYPRFSEIEGGIIEGFDVGVQSLFMWNHSIEDITFYDNGDDIHVTRIGDEWKDVHMKNIDFGAESGRGLDLNFSWGSTHPYKMFGQDLTIDLDGERVYLDQQDPDFVPFENPGDVDRLKSKGDVPGIFGLSSLDEVKSEIPGKTNAELQAEYGTSIFNELTPPEAESHPNVSGGVVGGSNESPSGDVTVDPAAMTGESVTAEVTGLSDADGSIDRVFWTYGDGQRSNGESMTTSFEEAGEHEITAHIIDDDGASELVSETVGVVDELEPSTNPGPVSPGVKYDVSDNIDPGSGGSGVHDQINLGVVGSPNEKDITYEGYLQVPESGAYRFTFIVNEKGTVYIDGTEVTGAQEEYDTTNTSTGHIGLEAGLHEIRVEYSEFGASHALEVRMDGGGMSGEIPADALYHEDEDGEVITDMPRATFSTTDEGGRTVSFDASGSNSPEGSISSYEWDFGDGSTASGETVEHTYDTGGFYDVALTVTDDADQTGDITKEVEVGEIHEIVIDGLDDQESDYELSVSGTLKKGEDASVVDTIDESTVSAEIGGAQDNYHYGGEVTSWSLDKDIPVKITIDGEEVDPSTLGNSDEPESISEAFDEDDDGEMDDDEILDAVEYWQDEEPVPSIGGEIIDDQKILDLVESWQGGGDK